MHLRAILGLGLGLLMSAGCTAATEAGERTVVAGVAPTEEAGGREVVQGTVTEVDPVTGRVHLDIRIVWAPVLRAEHRRVEVSVDPVTRFVPPTFRTRLQAGDEVQVSLSPGVHDHLHASEVTVLDLE